MSKLRIEDRTEHESELIADLPLGQVFRGTLISATGSNLNTREAIAIKGYFGALELDGKLCWFTNDDAVVNYIPLEAVLHVKDKPSE